MGRPPFTRFYTMVHGNKTAAWRLGDLKMTTFRLMPGEFDPAEETEQYDLSRAPGEQEDLWPTTDPHRIAQWLERLDAPWNECQPLMRAEEVQATHEQAIQGMGHAGGQ